MCFCEGGGDRGRGKTQETLRNHHFSIKRPPTCQLQLLRLDICQLQLLGNYKQMSQGLEMIRQNTVTGEIEVQLLGCLYNLRVKVNFFQKPSDNVRIWTQADVAELILAYEAKLAKLRWIKSRIQELVLSVVNFEVNDLDPVVESLVGFVDQLD